MIQPKIFWELIKEGWAREVVNRVQTFRKESGLEVSDRIDLEFIASKELSDALACHRDYIMTETLAQKLDISSVEGQCHLKFVKSCIVENMTCVVGLEVVSDNN